MAFRFIVIMTERCVAILGRRDEPTDAVEEYCQYLGRALSMEGIQLEINRVRWPELGWRESLRELRSSFRMTCSLMLRL